MTKVTMLKIGENIVGFEISGHSGYAKVGSDIVCAAISTLSYATIMGMEAVIGIDTVEVEDDAYLKLLVETKNKEKLANAQPLFKVLQLSIIDLANQYKDFVSICTKEIVML